MKILGLTIDVPTCSSAVLLEDGKILCGTPEERLNREKQSMKFPSRSISFCLDYKNIKIKDIDAIAVSWNPIINIYESTSSRLKTSSRHKAELLYITPANLIPFTGERPSFVKQVVALTKGNLETYYVNHHNCHAANSFFESRFRNAVILTCDGHGENETVTVNIGKGNNIERISTTIFPNSLGMFYGTITEYLGYRHDSDEWKVMALGAYGSLSKKLYSKLRDLFAVNKDLTIKVNTNLFQFDNALTKGMFNQEFIDYIGIPPRKREEVFSKEHYNLALATQRVFEDVIFDLCKKIRKKIKISNLCLGGGSFMNSLFNGKVASSEVFDNIYVPFSPNDAGGSLGAAQYVYYSILNNKRERNHTSVTPYIGPSYKDQHIEEVLNLFKCKYKRVKNIEKMTARIIADGNVVGWFQGAMEFGERALGNRSILADPRNPASKEKVNAVIKFRELFRPFAPSVLEECADEYFYLPKSGFQTPYMEKVFLIRKEKGPLIPSVTHADGTGRIQTVSKKENRKYYNLIHEFYSLTGVPILLNTSLNRNGEPMVCSPKDALEVFFGSGMDYLVLHNYIVEK